MENGKYPCLLRGTVSKRTLIAFNGTYKIFQDSKFIAFIDLPTLHNLYEVGAKQTKANQLYNILYIIGGIPKETITVNGPYAVCKSRINLMKRNTHSTGLLLIVPSNLS